MVLPQQGKIPNYYSVLGISPQATLDEIKLAYRRLVRLYHPDVSQDRATRQKFHQVQDAYETLSNRDKRRLYDIRFGHHNRQSTQAYQQQEDALKQAAETTKTSNPNAKPKVNLSESELKDSLSDLFEPLLAWFQIQANGPNQKSENHNSAFHPVYLTQQEADNGCIKRVEIKEATACERCSETGRVNNRACATCHGKGVLYQDFKLEVRIPKNCRHAQLLRIPKKNKRHLEKSLGNLEFWVLKICVAQIPRTLKVDGLNVIYNLQLTLPEIVLGGGYKIPSLDGKMDLEIYVPPFSQDNETLKLNGQGLSSALQGQTGHYLVKLEVRWPRKLSDKQKALYQQLRQLGL